MSSVPRLGLETINTYVSCADPLLLSAIAHRLLAIGYWLLAIGYWLFAKRAIREAVSPQTPSVWPGLRPIVQRRARGRTEALSEVPV